MSFSQFKSLDIDMEPVMEEVKMILQHYIKKQVYTQMSKMEMMEKNMDYLMNMPFIKELRTECDFLKRENDLLRSQIQYDSQIPADFCHDMTQFSDDITSNQNVSIDDINEHIKLDILDSIDNIQEPQCNDNIIKKNDEDTESTHGAEKLLSNDDIKKVVVTSSDIQKSKKSSITRKKIARVMMRLKMNLNLKQKKNK